MITLSRGKTGTKKQHHTEPKIARIPISKVSGHSLATQWIVPRWPVPPSPGGNGAVVGVVAGEVVVAVLAEKSSNRERRSWSCTSGSVRVESRGRSSGSSGAGREGLGNWKRRSRGCTRGSSRVESWRWPRRARWGRRSSSSRNVAAAGAGQRKVTAGLRKTSASPWLMGSCGLCRWRRWGNSKRWPSAAVRMRSITVRRRRPPQVLSQGGMGRRAVGTSGVFLTFTQRRPCCAASGGGGGLDARVNGDIGRRRRRTGCARGRGWAGWRERGRRASARHRM